MDGQSKNNLYIWKLHYTSMKNNLTVQDGIIFGGDHGVIPSRMRKDFAHAGIESCLRTAR